MIIRGCVYKYTFMTSKLDVTLDFRTPTNFSIQVYTLKL